MGKLFSKVLADPHHDIITGISAHRRYFLTDGNLLDIKLAKYECQGEMRSHSLAFHDTWKRIIHCCQFKAQKPRLLFMILVEI